MIIRLEDTDYSDIVCRVFEYNKNAVKYATVITFGCQQNEADSEKILTMLKAMGYNITDDYKKADLIVVNTCTIREHAKMKAFSLIGCFKALKKAKPELIVGIVGCMANEKVSMLSLKENFHFVTFTIEPNMLHKIPYVILNAIEENKRSFIINEDKGDLYEGIAQYRKHSHTAFVSIMYGCNNFCSYCIVPYVRGRERSRDSKDILKECKELIDRGVKEITLLGQNVNSYKSDIDFPSLIEECARIPGDFIIRFMTSHPKDVSERLIDVMAKYTPKIAPYFHLPLQSGSDKVLSDMRRTYTRERFLNTVFSIKNAIPEIALSTDVIVGFPTEEETDFLDTLDVLKEARFDMVYSFIYSKREGTLATKLTSVNTEEERRDRMDRLLRMQDPISLEKNKPYEGMKVRCLVDSVSKKSNGKTYTAKTYTNKLVHFESDEDLVGKFIDLKITKANAFDLYGEIEK